MEEKRSVVYRIFSLVIYGLLPLFVFGQELKPCGTTAYKSPWLKAYQQLPLAAKSRSNQDSILYIPMTIHSVGEDDGDGHFGTVNILDAFCQLNADFLESNIQFYLEEDIRLINNSAIYEHDSIHLGGLFMLEQDVPNSLNTYFLRNPAGTCGYNLPWASMALAKVCASGTRHTWAHEVGHHFTIQHPFLGWEDGISFDESIAPNYNQPAPDYVLYNYTIFKEQPFIDTLIIDTAFVEKVDGSNCHIAADGFCDTSPDYLEGRWKCQNNSSRVVQTDPNGDTFRSDASLIMSNAEEGCSSRFTPQQIAAMRAYILEERQDLFISPPLPQTDLIETPTLLYPIADELVPVDAVALSWDAPPAATSFIIEISRLKHFPIGLTFTYESKEPSLLVDNLVSDRDYFWRVRPYNFFHTCTDFTEPASFEVVESVTSIATIEGLTSLEILPTLQQVGQPIRIQLETDKSLTGTLELFNAIGKSLFTKPFVNANGLVTFSIPTSELTYGVYLVGVRTDTGFIFQRVVLN